ncbi:glycerol-3-phosphate dehydrogenase/oxidase [Virgibacillus flavescens]|uniref:glycerol-3-phosphate dehydrogenase/oxidase n=1 Tax=Virgibacillus flavescens TaxID=1611422 RepID=UPI003D33ADAA
MTIFSSHRRKEIYQNLTEKQLDILVIGGGITGAGISLDAASRGLRTGTIEMNDFAAGTSSRSTKLVHGGLRYLKQFEVKMVAEVGKERAIVYENGPHVTTPEWMMLPFHKGGNFGPLTTNIGLRVYDYLAGVKVDEHRKMFSPEVALEREPLIKKEGLKGAGYYVEYKTDDARLTIEVMKKAVQCGAHVINYAKAVEFLYNDRKKIIGAVVEDQLTGEKMKVFAKKVINAGGPWVDDLREIDGSKKGKTLHLTKGVHLVFSQKQFPLQQAIYFDAPDGRMIFAIPRNNKTYVGTTDTTFEGNIEHPTMTEEDRDYLLNAINYMFPTTSMKVEDVESSWAGIRPLIAEEGKDPNEISRKDEVFISDSGLLSMAGGKLTGYRKMAEHVVDKVVDQLKAEENILYSKSETEHLPISGGEVGGADKFKEFKKLKVAEAVGVGFSEEAAELLVQRYGSNTDVLLSYFESKKEVAKKANIDPFVFAELIYGMEQELVCKPVDFFIRRTGALYFEIGWVHDHKDAVTDYMADSFKWSDEQKRAYTAELDKLLHEAVIPEQ